MSDSSRSHLEQQLREAEHRAAADQIHFQGHLLDSVRQAVIATDTKGRITFWNRFAEELYGWKAEEVLGRDVLEIVAAPAATEQGAEIFEAISRGEAWSGEFAVKTRDGRVFTALVNDSPIFDAEGRLIGIVGVSQDIMELRAARLKQAALAQLGTIALGSAGLGFLFTKSTEVVRGLLSADCTEIQKVDDDQLVVVGRAGLSEGIETISSRAALARASLTSESGVVIERAGGRHVPLAGGEEPGEIFGISVTIRTGDRQEWGVFTAHTASAHRLSSGDVDFLRAVANLLGQAIDRRRAEVEVLIRASQQSALAEIGRLTSGGVTNSALERVCELVMQGLGVEYAHVLRPVSGGALEVVAGDRPPLDVAVDHAREVADTGESSVLLSRKGISGLASPMQKGVVCGYTTVPKQFTTADVQFLESLSFIISEAMDREAARAELTESERRFRSVVEGASEIIFSISTTGTILAINPAFEAITGWQVEEWLGRHFEGLLIEEEKPRVLNIFASLMNEPRHIRMQVRIQGRGRVVLVDAATSPKIVDGRVVEIYGFARDITEERRLETKLEQANRLSSLGRLAAMVAHEFNNVLMGIAPFTELLRRETLSERGSTAVDQIGRSVKRGKRITEDILRFAQPAEPAVSPVEVSSWLQGLAIEAHSLIGTKYTVDVESEEDISIVADANQLHQAFINLILNARDAMPQGGAISVRAWREEETPFVHFVVADTGSGMPPETIDRIFEPLFTTKKTGTGLGLPVTRQVVARHGGEISVESEVGEGTRFHLLIPIASTTGNAETTHPASGERHVRSVLLVEDEQSVASGIAALLESEGMDVQIVGTGAEVLPALEKSRPDAVILDIGLPDTDGTLVYQSIADLYPELPVVFSSGHGDATKLDRYLGRPHVGFLLKPYDIDSLLHMLERVTA